MKVSHHITTPLLCLLFTLSSSTAARKPLSSQELDALENVCQLESHSESMFCYCDHDEPGDATISNCWIYGDTRHNDTRWDTFYHQRKLHSITINLRGDGSLDFVPSRVLTYAPQLWTLEIKNAAITRVRSEAFAGSDSVAELKLTSNGIAHLGKHAFSNLSNLTRLDLGKNKVATLGRHVFRNLPKIKQLFLDRNSLSKIRSGAFGGLHSLQVLELYDNSLEEVLQGTFRGLKRLERLDLHRNLLETIEDDTFAALPSLRDLDLEGNRIKYISERGFSGLQKLMKLNLHDNKLLSILPGTFRETPGLFFLDIHQNVLDTLDERAFAPILDNMRNITMYLFVRDNALHCDCRLAWLLRLRHETASAHVRDALDTTVCHMETGSLPARLETGAGAGATPDPALETSTLGIGPPARLVDLKVHELPCDEPLVEDPTEGGERQKQPPSDQHHQKHHHRPEKHHQQQLQKQHRTADLHSQTQQDQGHQVYQKSSAMDSAAPGTARATRRLDSPSGGGNIAACGGWLLPLLVAMATGAAR